MSKFVKTGSRNTVVYKDKYYANFFVGETEIDASLLDCEVKVNGEVYTTEKDLVKLIYKFAGYNQWWSSMSKNFADFLLFVGYMRNSTIEDVRKEIETAERIHREMFGELDEKLAALAKFASL